MIGGVRTLDRSFVVRGHACLVKTLAACFVTAQPEMNSATDGCKSCYSQYNVLAIPTARTRCICICMCAFPGKQAIPS